MVATIITYNAGVMLSRMIFLPRHDQTDKCKKQAKGMAAFRVTNFSDEDLAIPSHHALPARYMGLFAMQSNRLGATALLLGSVADEKIDPADYSFAVKRRRGPTKPWRWEIYCACKAVPVERSPIFFESMAEAAKAGKKALAHLLAKRPA